MADNTVGPAPNTKGEIVDVPTIAHTEGSQPHSQWKSVKIADGDTAMALFDDPDELHEAIDPAEARKLLWKVDFMILPYLAVCYAFFYIDKVRRAFHRPMTLYENVLIEVDNFELRGHFQH